MVYQTALCILAKRHIIESLPMSGTVITCWTISWASFVETWLTQQHVGPVRSDVRVSRGQKKKGVLLFSRGVDSFESIFNKQRGTLIAKIFRIFSGCKRQRLAMVFVTFSYIFLVSQRWRGVNPVVQPRLVPWTPGDDQNYRRTLRRPTLKTPLFSNKQNT